MSLSLPAGPDARRRPSHLKGFLRLLPFLLAAMGLAWLALDGLVFRESARHMRDLERVSAIHRNYREATEAAGLLKAGSDALTQAVRRYAATGRPSFLHAYEQEEHIDRHRERALEIIERMPDADDAARRMLRTAMEESLALQDVEHRAMRLVAEATGMPREEMPEHLRAVVLSSDQEALDAPGKRARAIDLLYDEAYFAAKSNIWAGVNAFLDRTIGETQDTFDDTTKKTIRSVTRQMVLFTLALAVVFGALILSASVGYAMFARMTRENLGLMDDLRRERDATLAAEKARSMFFSMVSHDIRTPLNSIIGFSEMLREGVADPKERAENIENILFSAHTLLDLVNDVLDLSKLDAEKMKFSYAPCDLPALLSRIAGTFRFQTEQKGLALRVECPTMPRLVLDEERIRQVLVNLVGNAVKFTEKGEVALEAEFAPDPAPRPNEPANLRTFEPSNGAQSAPLRGTLRFSVRDTGIGIRPEDRERVLEPFVQVDSAHPSGGTGLGLPICHRMLVRMGGDLTIESEPGKGSTFTGVIPGVETAPEETTEHTESTEKNIPASSVPSVSSVSSVSSVVENKPAVRSVLVVDDVPVNVLVEQAMLKRAGVPEVVTAPSAADALETLEKHGAFDLVLTDLWMPELDGYALCARIRADDRWKALRVYAVTADVEARKTVADRGFDGILLKPLTADALSRFLAGFRPSA
ncbi:MAG: response regulator [Kiritimatiellae bacterium]|nr:response regulator [Kiritimatiellia bacterium]